MKALFHLLLLFFSISVFAQNTSPIERHQKMMQFKHFDSNEKHSDATSFFLNHGEELGVQGSQFISVSKRSSDKKRSFERMQQYHYGKKVIGAHYILHSNDEGIFKAHGLIAPDLGAIQTPHIDEALAINIAQEKINQEKLDEIAIPINPNIKWEESKSSLVYIDKRFPVNSGDFVLAYEVKLESQFPLPIKTSVYINAFNGKLIDHFSDIHSAPIESTPNTFYYGAQTITVEETDGKYLMIDNTRDGLNTIDATAPGQAVVSSSNNNWDSNNELIPWAAADAHYCTASFYDFMQDHFEWDGIDGIGGALVSRVNQGGKYYTNAFWDGTRASFGNGNCDSYNALTTLDVVGHEFMHGIVDYTSDLVYRNQSGALNESAADIIGKALEYQYDPQNFTWNLGIKAAKNPGITGFRSMNDPFSKNDPKYYAGQNWYTGSGDNGGVHSNSGVMNYWFYLLVEGESGTNEVDYNYNVVSIGWDNALQIVFNAHLGYLGPNSNYFDAMYATIEEAKSLFGDNSQELQSVIEAWKTCGLFEGIDNKDISVEAPIEDIGICPGDEKYADIIIRNTGTEKIDAGKQINIDYSIGSEVFSESVLLSSDFNPTDSILYMLEGAITAYTSNNFSVRISVTVDDDLNILNNQTTIGVRTSSTPGTDIRLISFRFSQDSNCGIPNLIGYTYTLQNTGCTILNEGDSIYFKINTGSEEIVIGRELFFDFEPGNYQGSSRTLDTPIIGNFNSFSANLEVEEDLNEDNNSYDGTVSFIKIIENAYYENFTPEVNDELFFVSSNQYYGLDSIYNYNGNHALAFTGQRSSASFVNCEESEDFFDQYYYRSILRYCVSTEGMDRPTFAFDLTQIINESFTGILSNNEYGSMVKIVTDSLESEIFFGQETGETINRSIELPQNYNGNVEVQVITLSGNTEVFELDLQSADVALIDNVRLFDQTEEDIRFENRDFLLFPNPTSGSVAVQSQSTSQEYDILIYDQLGRIVFEQKQINYLANLDLTALSSGVYYVSFIEEGLDVHLQKLVVAP